MEIERLSTYLGDSLIFLAAAGIAGTLGHRAYQRLSPDTQALFKKILPCAAALGTLYAGVVLYRAYNVAPPAPQKKIYQNPIWDVITDAAKCYEYSYDRTISYPFCSLECAKYHKAASAVEKLAGFLVGFGAELFR